MSIELKNVTYTYSPGTAYEIHALKNINLTIPGRSVYRYDRPHRKRKKVYSDPAFQRSDPSYLRKRSV